MERCKLEQQSRSVSYDYLAMPTGEKIIVETFGNEAIAEGTAMARDFVDADAFFFDAKSELRLR